ncbi:MAG: adenosylcobinamide-GDP ribazoletransferase [Candidatus Thermoplasmatota archaeon]|nr:adenosylcobinamide-GDP ribazoletransferase [Candidatus Thermoplasmatota archaeon]
MKGFIDSISFFTIFPAGRNSGPQNDIIYFFTLTGILTAILPAIIFYFASSTLGTIAGSALSLSALLLISGFNHLDGVLDSGDALMAQVDPSRRQEIIKDRFTGAGGVGTVLIIYLTYFAVLSSLTPVYGFFAILISEMLAKMVMLVTVGTFPAFGNGLANMFRGFYQKARVNPALINLIPVIVISVFSGISGIISIIPSLVFGFFFARWMKGKFDGINGDIAAMSGEATRVVAVIIFAMTAVFSPHLWGFPVRIL